MLYDFPTVMFFTRSVALINSDLFPRPFGSLDLESPRSSVSGPNPVYVIPFREYPHWVPTGIQPPPSIEMCLFLSVHDNSETLCCLYFTE
ncbi:hypothetical protein MT325_m418R [Paramecium bursaria chlorella virus MT325]|uniref:Uncharacterized protein m418R n=1 Tax=Paramecium bursaria Chlorella virus MT325 TaxID=346932 RepID=A7IUE8_PBCVM|nr:hypothetical protein MT325_m418R [Paramecium bursaria chlorella virus MT325]